MSARTTMEFTTKHQLRMLTWNGMKTLTDEESKIVQLYDALVGKHLDTRVLSDEALMLIAYLYGRYVRLRSISTT